MVDVFALVLFFLPGFFIALNFLRPTQAIFASGIFSGLLTIVSGVVHVWIDFPIHVIWLVISILALLIVFTVPKTRNIVLLHLRARLSATEIMQLATLVVIVPLVALLPPAPLGWDARSIWLFHASWLNDSSGAFITAQTLPAIAWSHPDYPLFGPAAIASIWGLLGQSENLSLGLQLVTLVTLFTSALAGSLAIEKLSKQGNLWLNLLAFILLIAVGFSVGSGLFNQAYMDALQAFLVVALISSLLPATQSRLSWSQASLASVITLAAMNVKQEGFWFAVAVVFMMLLSTLRDQYLAKYLPLVSIVMGYIAWKIFLESINSVQQSDVAGVFDRANELLHFDSTGWHILTMLITNQGASSLGKIIALMLASGAVILFIRCQRSSIQLISIIFGSWLAIVAVIFLTYSLAETRNQIDWWLATSFNRVIATPVLIGWFTIFIAVIISTDSWNSDFRSKPKSKSYS